MRELRDILRRAEALAAAGQPAVLATIVAVEGSAYRREGARQLLEADGNAIGVLSGGCLEQDLAERARAVLASGLPALAVYDLRAPDEVLWGLGLGCGGKITLLLEPLPAPASRPSPLAPLVEIARTRRPATVETRFEGELLLSERIDPPLRLWLAGAGRDALPLARLADELGWEVTVLDLRPTAAAAARFEANVRYVELRPRDLETRLSPDPWTTAVVLTHQYLDDLAWLAALLPLRLPYVGLLGPVARRERLLADLAMQGFEPDAEMQAALHGPAGLDLGGRSPEEVALAIVAEIQAATSGRLTGGERTLGAASRSLPAPLSRTASARPTLPARREEEP